LKDAGVVLPILLEITRSSADESPGMGRPSVFDLSQCSPVDLAPYYNTSTFWTCSRWRVGTEYPLSASRLTGSSGVLHTEAGLFTIPVAGPCIVRIERGRSDPVTRALIPGAFPSEREIPIGLKCTGMVLLYASEMESRHTDCVVGSMELQYRSGARQAIALRAGSTFTSLFGHFARDTMPVSLAAIGNPEDSLSVLTIPCDASGFLDRIRIAIDVPDAWFGLLAASILQADPAP
jgi:hypothetical protein